MYSLYILSSISGADGAGLRWHEGNGEQGRVERDASDGVCCRIVNYVKYLGWATRLSAEIYKQ